MHSRLLVVLMLLTPFLACKNDSSTTNPATGAQSANADNLGGMWINLDFCSRAGQYGSVMAAENNAHRPYAFALVFNPAQPDSVQCFNAFESWKLPVTINQDTIELKNAKDNKSVFLIYDSQGAKDIIMYDGVSGASTYTDKFLKSRANARNGYEAFERALNNQLFSGRFNLLAKGGAEKIRLLPDGSVEGWPAYNRYKVCTGGDCLVMGGSMDIITLSNSKQAGSEQTFAFQYSSKNDTLSLLNLIDATPGEKGGYATKGTAYRFLRMLPQQR